MRTKSSIYSHVLTNPYLDILLICVAAGPWIGTCVGKGNYRSFTAFLWCLTSLVGWVVAFSCYGMYQITKEQSLMYDVGTTAAFRKMLGRNPIALILAIYAVIASSFVYSLTFYHAYLVFTAQTTNEQLKHSFPHGSPFSSGLLRNIINLCCQVPAKSRLPNLNKSVAIDMPQLPSSNTNNNSLNSNLSSSGFNSQLLLSEFARPQYKIRYVSAEEMCKELPQAVPTAAMAEEEKSLAPAANGQAANSSHLLVVASEAAVHSVVENSALSPLSQSTINQTATVSVNPDISSNTEDAAPPVAAQGNIAL
jgi:hypothetical protein